MFILVVFVLINPRADLGYSSVCWSLLCHEFACIGGIDVHSCRVACMYTLDSELGLCSGVFLLCNDQSRNVVYPSNS